MSAKEQILSGIKAVSPLVWAAENKKGRSCFLCEHFRFREKGTLIVCDQHQVVYQTDEMNTHPEKAHRILRVCALYAEHCGHYEEVS